MKSCIKFFNLYFLFTVLYYVFGKWVWNIPSYVKLLSYLFLCYLMLNVGYKLSWKGHGILKIGLNRSYMDIPVTYENVRPIFWISSICLIVFQITWVLAFFDSFSIANIFQVLGENYYSRLETSFDSSIPIMQLRTLFWGVSLFSYPIGFLLFSEMPFLDRILLLLTVSIDVFASLNMGVSKYIGDIVIIFIGITLLKYCTGTKTSDNGGKQKGNFKKIAIVIVVFLVIFVIVQNLRGEETTVRVNPYGKFASINENAIHYVVFGENSFISNLLDNIGAYVSHSYTGLAYALELPFENTYGIGFSRSLMEYVEQYLHISLSYYTYNARADLFYGWHNGQWWPTAFTWIANAVSFWGVPIVMLLLGIFIRHLEDDYANNKNILSAVMYGQMVITLIYLPCNMQIFQSRSSLWGMVMIIFLWILRFRYFRFDLRTGNQTYITGR